MTDTVHAIARLQAMDTTERGLDRRVHPTTRSWRIGLALAALAFGQSCGRLDARQVTPLTQMRIEAMTDSLGINVHINYPDTCYADLPAVRRDLAYVGLSHIREGSNPGYLKLADYVDLAKHGIRYDLIIGSPARMETSVAFAASIAAQVPGAISSFEGFNEVNNWPVTYGGQTGAAGARAAQAAFYKLVHAQPALAQVPVIYLTGAPVPEDLTGLADLTAVHAYNNNATQPEHWIRLGLRDMPESAGKLPVMNTEFGNFTIPNGWPADKPLWAGHTALGVDQLTQAKIIITEYLASARVGMKRSFVYELCDEHRDPTSKSAQNAFGVFTFDHQPKLAATAIRRMTTYLKSRAAPSGASQLHAEAEAAAASSAPLTMELEGANGRSILVAWNTAEFWTWSGSTSHALPDTLMGLTVSLKDNHGAAWQGKTLIEVFDPVRNGMAVTTQGRGPTVTLQIPNHPVFIEVFSVP